MHSHSHDHSDGNGHTHEHMDHPGHFRTRELPLDRDLTQRAFTVGRIEEYRGGIALSKFLVVAVALVGTHQDCARVQSEAEEKEKSAGERWNTLGHFG